MHSVSLPRLFEAHLHLDHKMVARSLVSTNASSDTKTLLSVFIPFLLPCEVLPKASFFFYGLDNSERITTTVTWCYTMNHIVTAPMDHVLFV